MEMLSRWVSSVSLSPNRFPFFSCLYPQGQLTKHHLLSSGLTLAKMGQVPHLSPLIPSKIALFTTLYTNCVTLTLSGTSIRTTTCSAASLRTYVSSLSWDSMLGANCFSFSVGHCVLSFSWRCGSDALLSTTASVSTSSASDEGVVSAAITRQGVAAGSCAPEAPFPEEVLSSRQVAPPPRRPCGVMRPHKLRLNLYDRTVSDILGAVNCPSRARS